MTRKLEQRIAYYADGTIIQGKTTRKQFNADNLIGIVSFYTDGTREQEAINAPRELSVELENSETAQYARLILKANLQFKYDGGQTVETKKLRKRKA